MKFRHLYILNFEEKMKLTLPFDFKFRLDSNRELSSGLGLQVILFGLLITLILSPSAFKNWALRIKDDSMRKPMLDLATGIESALSYHETSRYSLAVQSRFQSFQESSSFQVFEPQTSLLPVSNREPASVSKTLESALFFGDSVLKSILESKLKNVFQSRFSGVEMNSFARISTGLARPDVFNWPDKIAEYSSKKHVGATFLFFGTNDTQGVYEGAKGFAFASEGWRRVYLQRVKKVFDNACQFSDHVYWVGSLPVGDEVLNKDLMTLNQIVSEFISQYSPEDSKVNKNCPQFVDVSSAMTDENKKFTSYLKINDNLVKIREKDGVHLTGDGAHVVARFLADFIENKKAADEAQENIKSKNPPKAKDIVKAKLSAKNESK